MEEQDFLKTASSSYSLSFINYLDAHLYEGKVCVSNGECEDIENAFRNADWGKICKYYNKFTQNPTEWNNEDDRTKEKIIKGFCNYGDSFKTFGGLKVEDIIAWLEKQKPVNALTAQEAMDIAVAKCFEEGEQKSAVWSDKDERIKEFLNNNLDRYDPYIGWTKEEFINEFINFINKEL